jgi:hypothetical protein
MFKLIIIFMVLTLGITLGLTVLCAKERFGTAHYVKVLTQHEYEPWRLKKR